MKNTYRKLLLLLFITITSCGQIDPNKQVDEGKVENDTYTSQAIGWTIQIPKKWKVISKAQNEDYKNKGADAIEGLVDGEIDISGLKNLIGFQKNKLNLFQSTSEPFKEEFEGDWEANSVLIKELIYNTYGQQGIKADSTATKIVKIDGLDFQSYNFTLYQPNGDVLLKQIMYSRLINGLDFGVNINYNNESDKKEMVDAFLNSKFKK